MSNRVILVPLMLLLLLQGCTRRLSDAWQRIDAEQFHDDFASVDGFLNDAQTQAVGYTTTSGE